MTPNLLVSDVRVDSGAVEASRAALAASDFVASARHKPGRDPSSHDSPNDLKGDVDDRVDDGVEATNCGAKAHGRVQVAAADVSGHVDPHGQCKAIHEGCQFLR